MTGRNTKPETADGGLADRTLMPDHAPDDGTEWTGAECAGADRKVSDTEVAVMGSANREEIDHWVAGAVNALLGDQIQRLIFRAGRIDAVYGLLTKTGSRVVLKVHRLPVDLEARRLASNVQQLLADTGFPCPRPFTGPTRVGDKVVSAETLLSEGDHVDGHDPLIRRAIAAGLAEHVTILARYPHLLDQVGLPPAWCDYRHGAWRRTHDPIFDFRTTPSEYAWLQQFAQDASETLLAQRFHRPPVIAHADWYCGNLRFDSGRLVAALDWDLIADQEAVIAGLAAATFAEGPHGPPSPQEVAGFLADYEQARQIRFSVTERTAAQAAARWNIAYSARCDLTNAEGHPPPPQSALELLTTKRTEYFNLNW